MLLLVEHREDLVLVVGDLKHSIFVAFLETRRLKDFDGDLDDTVAECESQLAKANRHVDAHEDTQ